MKTALLLIATVLCHSAHSQEVSSSDGSMYHVNVWKSIGLTVAGETAVLLGQNFFSKPDITDQEFDIVQTPESKKTLNVFDRWVLNIGKPSVDYTWPAVDLQAVCAVAPLALFFGERYRKNWSDIVLMLLETNALTTCMFQFSPFGPYFQNRYRPVIYYATDSVSRAQEKNGGNRNSLFSGHTASATASLFCMAKIYTDYNPHIRGWNKVGIYALASIPPLVMGYLRVIALRHFPSDILVGAIIGGICGIVVPELHRINDKTAGTASSPTNIAINIAWIL